MQRRDQDEDIRTVLHVTLCVKFLHCLQVQCIRQYDRVQRRDQDEDIRTVLHFTLCVKFLHCLQVQCIREYDRVQRRDQYEDIRTLPPFYFMCEVPTLFASPVHLTVWPCAETRPG